MAVQTFPMLLADFFGDLPIQTATPDLGEALEMSETGGGEVLTADIGPRLWMMDVTIRPGYYADIEPIKAKLNVLRHAGRSLLVHSIPLIAPRADPTGAILGASAVKLTSVAANNREMTISGLPANYQLSSGDFLSFTYGSNPVRYAMHQIFGDIQANGSGVATNVEVTTFVRPGWAVNAPITLIKPVFKAVIVPGSTSPGTVGQMMTTGLKFSLMQTLR